MSNLKFVCSGSCVFSAAGVCIQTKIVCDQAVDQNLQYLESEAGDVRSTTAVNSFH